MTLGVSGQNESEWEKVATVISRSLAFLCLQYTPAKDGGVLEKADFLRSLGLPYSDSAGMIGSTEASIKELARLAKKPRGAGRGKQAKGKGKRAKR
jgi:hypothetical protein